MWPAGHADLPPAAAESALELREGFVALDGRGQLRAGVTPRDAARALSAALSGGTAAITRDPDDPGNARLSATVRDAVIDALVAPSATRSPRSQAEAAPPSPGTPAPGARPPRPAGHADPSHPPEEQGCPRSGPARP